MTDDQGQRALAATAEALISRLEARASVLRPIGDTEHMQHRELAWRSRLLGLYIRQAVQAVHSRAYPAAFALLRSALEHRVFDRLLFLAELYEQEVSGVTDEAFARWEAEPHEYLESSVRVGRDRLRLVWRGPRVVDDEGRVVHLLSIYYKWWREYDPFTVPDPQFEHIASGHPSRRQERAAYRHVQQRTWRTALTWLSLKANLKLNRLATDRELLQLDVHHRFLSAFVHAFSKEVVDRVYRQRVMGDWPEEDHYSQELVLLYACWLALDELRDFQQMTLRRPEVSLADADEIAPLLETVEAQITHLWAPGRGPYAYDRVHEANQLVFDAYDAQHASGQPMVRPAIPDPRSLPEDEIRYYDDPLRRLIRLHASSTEMTTGLTWLSPWPRDDAQYHP